MKNICIRAVGICFFLFYFLPGYSQAQNSGGTITGSVIDSADAAMIGAVVTIEGQPTLGASVDVEGLFEIKNVPAGTHTVKITYLGFAPKIISNVVVVDGETTDLKNQTLESDAKETVEIEVIGTKRTNSEAAGVKEVKESEQVVNVITAEQISKSQDRDAAAVMQRIPGITIVDNRFVMVRGLNQRYNVVMLNGIIAPSTETDSRAFSFDLVPSSLLDRILVTKSGAPELPGDVAGAVINVYTRNTVSDNSNTFSIGTGYRNGTTFKKHLWNKGGSTDFLGYDDGKRKLPSSFPAHLNDIDFNGPAQETAAKSLRNNWTMKEKNVQPDLRLGYTFTRQFNIGNVKFSNISSVNYSNTWQFVKMQNQRHQTTFDPITNSYTLLYKYQDDRLSNNIRLGLLHNWRIMLNARNRIEWRNMFTQLGLSETTYRQGQNFTTSSQGNDVQSRSFYFQSRGIYTGQLQGTHEFKNERTKFTWIGGYAKIISKEPDLRRGTSVRLSGTDNPFLVVIPGSASDIYAARFYSDLNESTISATASLEHILVKKENEDNNIRLRGGYYLESRSREFSSRWISYVRANGSTFNNALELQGLDSIFAPQNINATTGFVLDEQTDASNKYKASNFLNAAYIGTTIPFYKFVLSTGLRLEINNRQLDGATQGGTKVNTDTTLTNLLPFVNLAFNLTKKMLVRASYSSTINRPEFREMAPFGFYQFDVSAGFVGNPKLKNATIHNYDVRWELYPSPSETVSFGLFYKSFRDPIELYIIPTGSFDPNFTYGNAKKAMNYGAELEIRKALVPSSNSRIIKNLTILANASIIKSSVDLGVTAGGQANERALQGQSPYVVNGGLYYNDEEKLIQMNLLYNVFGKRIFGIGDSQFATIYEMPRNIVDFTITKGFGEHIEIKAGAQDIFNQTFRLVEDNNSNFKIDKSDQETVTFKRGTYYTFAVGFKF